MIEFYVVGSALEKSEPRDVDIFGVLEDDHFRSVFGMTRPGKVGDGERWIYQNLGATRILQAIFPELVPIDFKFMPRFLLERPHRRVDIKRPSREWGIGTPDLKLHSDELIMED